MCILHWCPQSRARYLDYTKSLDLQYISPKVIVMGLPWLRRTERLAARNNVKELGAYLEQAHSNSFMVFNLAPFERGAQYNHSMLNNQVCEEKRKNVGCSGCSSCVCELHPPVWCTRAHARVFAVHTPKRVSP